jgi:hypothetical protein
MWIQRRRYVNEGELYHSAVIAFDKLQNLLIQDSDNHRIQLFSQNETYICALGSDVIGQGNILTLKILQYIRLIASIWLILQIKTHVCLYHVINETFINQHFSKKFYNQVLLIIVLGIRYIYIEYRLIISYVR